MQHVCADMLFLTAQPLRYWRPRELMTLNNAKKKATAKIIIATYTSIPILLAVSLDSTLFCIVYR